MCPVQRMQDDYVCTLQIPSEQRGKSDSVLCIISSSRTHDPLGIWAHLDPVRKMIQEEHPNVTCLHFLSDGPASQYKQKANFIFCPLYLSRKGFPQPPGTSLKPVMARGHKMGSAEHLKELQTI